MKVGRLVGRLDYELFRRCPLQLLEGLVKCENVVGRFLDGEIDELRTNGVRLRIIGERSRLAPDIVRLIEDAEARTAGNRKLTLVVAFSYGGRHDIVVAARRLAEAAAAGRLDPRAIDEGRLAAELFTEGIPDPDLVIRTSGEQRISNFLLWQSAYSELVFLDKHWPDFVKDDSCLSG